MITRNRSRVLNNLKLNERPTGSSNGDGNSRSGSVKQPKVEKSCVKPIKAEKVCVKPTKAEMSCIKPTKVEKTFVKPTKAEKSRVKPTKIEKTCVTPTQAQKSVKPAIREKSSAKPTEGEKCCNGISDYLLRVCTPLKPSTSRTKAPRIPEPARVSRNRGGAKPKRAKDCSNEARESAIQTTQASNRTDIDTTTPRKPKRQQTQDTTSPSKPEIYVSLSDPDKTQANELSECEVDSSVKVAVGSLVCCYDISPLALSTTTNHTLLPKSPTSIEIVGSPLLPTISVNSPGRNKSFHQHIQRIADSRMRTLGKGSFGTVIQATYKGQLVAVKIVAHSKVRSLENELNNFLLCHENIVSTLRICCMDEAEACGLVIMEMYSSINLDHLTNDKSFLMDGGTVLSFARDIGEALKHCHRQRVVHLDVKPRNVLVNLSSNACKLCDYGSSCLLADEILVKGTPTELQGTIIYTAPELLIGERPTDKADVYSFGITLWQLIYRENPYKLESADLQSTIYKIVKEKHRPPVKGQEARTMLENLCVQCWNADAKQRPTIGFTLEEIIELQQSLPEAIPNPT